MDTISVSQEWSAYGRFNCIENPEYNKATETRPTNATCFQHSRWSYLMSFWSSIADQHQIYLAIMAGHLITQQTHIQLPKHQLENHIGCRQLKALVHDTNESPRNLCIHPQELKGKLKVYSSFLCDQCKFKKNILYCVLYMYTCFLCFLTYY